MTDPGGTAGAIHYDVAAYALGALDPDSGAAFREHLGSCPPCRAELESMSGVTALLSTVDLAQVRAVSEQPGPAVLDGALRQVRDTRRRSRQRLLASAAAAVVLIVGGPVVAAVTFSDARSPAGSSTAAPALAGTLLTATDPTTGVSARVGMQATAWGTQAGLELSGVRGPRQCELVAVARNGEPQVMTSWSVPPAGYGTPEHPKPLRTTGGAAFRPEQIDHLTVRTTPDQRELVSVPVTGTPLSPS